MVGIFCGKGVKCSFSCVLNCYLESVWKEVVVMVGISVDWRGYLVDKNSRIWCGNVGFKKALPLILTWGI